MMGLRSFPFTLFCHNLTRRHRMRGREKDTHTGRERERERERGRDGGREREMEMCNASQNFFNFTDNFLCNY